MYSKSTIQMKKNILLFVSVFAIGFIGFKVFLTQVTQKNDTFKLKKGTWVLEQDSLSSLEITEKRLVFKHEGSSKANETYNYFVSEQTANDAGMILKIYNSTDTLRYEITSQNDTLLKVLDLNFGNINLYYKKK